MANNKSELDEDQDLKVEVEDKAEDKKLKKQIEHKKKQSEQKKNHTFDIIKWVVGIVLIMAAIILNQKYAEEFSVVIRAIFVIVVFVIAALIIFSSSLGKRGLLFLKESQMEIRKVIWPSRQEALNTTFIVLAATGVFGLVMWGLDSASHAIVQFITSI